jgi:hypothetical protein
MFEFQDWNGELMLRVEDDETPHVGDEVLIPFNLLRDPQLRSENYYQRFIVQSVMRVVVDCPKPTISIRVNLRTKDGDE